MKRDWDVIRLVLLEIEPLPSRNRSVYVGNYATSPDEEILKLESIKLLLDAGFIEGLESNELGLGRIEFQNLSLKWRGHELLDTLREKSTFDQMKNVAKSKGIALSFETLKILFTAVVKELLSHAMQK
jgi:hypothetical protein